MSCFTTPILTFADKSKIYLSSAKDVFSHTTNWRFNRPADECKLEEIREYYESNPVIDYMDGLILVNYLKGQGYVRFDGNNRIEGGALVERDLKVLVQVSFLSEEELKKKFLSINKSNPCPEFYTSENSRAEIKEATEDVVLHFVRKYPKFFTASARPQRPNKNRDNFKDELYNYLSDKNILFSTKEIVHKMNEYNAELAENLPFLARFNDKIVDKCEKYGFYLFLDKDFISNCMENL